MSSQDQTAEASIMTDAIAAGVLERLGSDRAGLRAWRAHDLAAMVEGAFGVSVDPATLRDARRARRWLAQLGDTYRSPPEGEPDRWSGLRCWLLDDRRRVGTIGLGPTIGATAWLPVFSLYVEPAARGRAVATRALRHLAAAAGRRGLSGIRLGTHWTWQKSLRYYLARGLWVVGWKHDVQLVLEPGLPRYRVTVDGDVAHLAIQRGRKPPLTRVLTARREGDRLELSASAWLCAPTRLHLHRVARCTFAVSLALAGWPLVRSEAHWARRYGWSDGGDPEGLAYKIGVFEALAAEHRWVIDTPSIPGLERWQAWARGEEHGRTDEARRSIAAVLSGRELVLCDSDRERLEAVSDPWVLERLLRRAATASSTDELWEDT